MATCAVTESTAYKGLPLADIKLDESDDDENG